MESRIGVLKCTGIEGVGEIYDFQYVQVNTEKNRYVCICFSKFGPLIGPQSNDTL